MPEQHYRLVQGWEHHNLAEAFEQATWVAMNTAAQQGRTLDPRRLAPILAACLEEVPAPKKKAGSTAA